MASRRVGMSQFNVCKSVYYLPVCRMWSELPASSKVDLAILGAIQLGKHPLMILLIKRLQRELFIKARRDGDWSCHRITVCGWNLYSYFRILWTLYWCQLFRDAGHYPGTFGDAWYTIATERPTVWRMGWLDLPGIMDVIYYFWTAIDSMWESFLPRYVICHYSLRWRGRPSCV